MNASHGQLLAIAEHFNLVDLSVQGCKFANDFPAGSSVCPYSLSQAFMSASSVSEGRPRRFRHHTHFQIGISDFTEYGCTRISGHPHRHGSATTMSRP